MERERVAGFVEGIGRARDAPSNGQEALSEPRTDDRNTRSRHQQYVAERGNDVKSRPRATAARKGWGKSEGMRKEKEARESVGKVGVKRLEREREKDRAALRPWTAATEWDIIVV